MGVMTGTSLPLEASRLRAALTAHRLVNLAGPLGVGKTRLAAGLEDVDRVDLDRPGALTSCERALAAPASRPLVVDGADGRHRRDALHDLLERLPVRRPAVLVVSRTPLTADARWADSGAVVRSLGPVCDGWIALRTAGLDAEVRQLVDRLAGGIPLLAVAVCRALEAGGAAADPGVVADQVAGEVLDRLGRELPGRRWQHTLRQLATVRSADERLLGGGPDHFTSLASLSIVRRGRLGLEVAEPYRTLFELAYQWRKPEAHATTRIRARDYRIAGLAVADEPARRADLTEQGLFLSGDRLLRRELFPAKERRVAVRRARPQDADAVGRLMRAWAVHSGFDPGRCDRLTQSWAGDDITAFRLACDPNGKVVGLANLTPAAAHPGTLEPLLQQHSEVLGGGGLFLGMTHCPDPAVRAHLLRHLLRDAVEEGRLVVSTANPDYQTLVRGLGFTVHGGIRDDVFRCGRPPEVYSHDFTAARIPRWLGHLAHGEPGSPQGRQPGPRLAPKELRILLDYTSGMTLKSAARRAGVTPNTAKDYLSRVKAKYRTAGRPAYTKIDLARRVREDGLDRM